MRLKSLLTFVIPVRHPANAKDWQRLRANLEQTSKSIAAQDCAEWQAIVVANHGADLPIFPNQFRVVRVDFPPNKVHEQGGATQEDFFKAFRSDKGRRVLSGLLESEITGHVMIVDDDDFVSRRLASFVAENPRANGWFFRDGYVWGDGGKLLFKYSDFSRLCGTSHIVRVDLFQLPRTLDDAGEDWIQEVLGSHVFLHDRLDAAGTPLAALPFEGAIYRTGHPGAHSRSRGIIWQFFLKKALLKRPHTVFGRIFRLRSLNERILREFFGRLT